MGGLILILQLGLVITPVFTVSSVYSTNAEPNPDLECINDFLTEMVCSLTSDQVVTCSEYDLKVSRDDETFFCDLKQLNSRACKCFMYMESSFVLGELYKVKVLRGNNTVFTKYVNTTKSIKPKKPTRVLVKETENGNFLITWDTEYRTEEHVFNSGLISELIYYVEGSKEKRINVTVWPKGRFEYELVGKSLLSYSHYILMVRIKSPVNQRFSDYSHAVKFTTPMSPDQVLKIIIPTLCIILIISVLVIYYLCNKILTEWWGNIPTPKIATSFMQQVPNLLLFQYEFSPVHFDSSKLVQSGDKKWPASSPVNIINENSLTSLGKDCNSSEVNYSQTLIQSLDENSHENKTQGKESRSTSNPMPVSTQYYKNLKLTHCNGQREHGNNSDFYNILYKFYNETLEHSVNPKIPTVEETSTPMIKTDFEYGPWTRSSGSANSTLSQFPTPSSEITVVHGYQSIDKVQDCESKNQTFFSSCNDVNVMTESIGSKKAPNVSCESPISVENEYKDIQSLLRNSEKQKQTLISDPALKQLWDQDLHTHPGIEIDSSYHRV